MLWLAILCAFLPLIGYVVLLRLPYARRHLGPGGVLALMILLGLLTPVGACILALQAIQNASPPGRPNCGTGASIFVVGGYFLTLVGLPVLALVRAGGNWLARRMTAAQLRRAGLPQ